MTNGTDTAAIDAFRAAFGERFATTGAVRDQHDAQEGHFEDSPPDGVLFAQSKDDVVKAVELCAEHKTPIIPYGAGSSLEGHLTAVRGGISIDMSGMDQIIDISVENQTCRIQPGVTRQQLNLALRDQGLFFPVDPGAEATIGGMAATRASGTNAVRYGTMRDVVKALEVVTADGAVMRTGSAAAKTSAGYDLTALMVGSEGTLGIITELTVKLSALPEAVMVATCAFETLEGAVASVIDAKACSLPMARIELMNAAQVKAVNTYSKTALPEKPTLILECHGSETSVAEQQALLEDITAGNGGAGLAFATKTEDRNALWDARHKAYFAGLAAFPRMDLMTTDVCVPIANLPACIMGTEADFADAGIEALIVGHVGDGNFHSFIPIEPGSSESLEKAEALNSKIVQRALDLGGTCTGEHGIGLGKKHYLELEQGAAIPWMRAIKSALDPQKIMNPGKIF